MDPRALVGEASFVIYVNGVLFGDWICKGSTRVLTPLLEVLRTHLAIDQSLNDWLKHSLDE